jgi:signal transduction histidine kinase
VVVGTVLITGQSPSRSTIEDKYLAGVNQSLVIAAVGGALIAFVLGMYLARTLTRPVRELTQATRAMAQGNFDQRIATRSKDEIGELAESFNQMSADLAFANQSRRQMTADIAHDLRNPLTVIHGYLEALKDGKLSSTPERYETMLAEVTQLQRLVDDLRTLSLADTGELALYRQPVQAANLAAQVAAAYRHQAEQQEVRLLTEIGANLADASLDPDRIVQVLGNLVSNALRYTPAGGVITLSADMSGGNLLLSVRDTGMGIPAEVLPRIFERSYRGDASRSGSESGLGLAIAKSIVELHGGTIRAESSPQGSIFTIELPA